MFARLETAIGALRDEATSAESRTLTAEEARRLVQLAADGERACQALRATGTQAALRTRAWFGLGYRTPGQWLAARTGTSEGRAISAVQTAARLRGLPATRDALMTGRISESQAVHITEAAARDPGAEGSLLELAERTTVRELRDRCQQVVAAAESDEDAAERVRRGRFLRHWTDRDGAVRLDGRLAPDDGALVVAAVVSRAARLQDEARRSGQREPAEAHKADALVSLARGDADARAVVHVHVDAAALERGTTKAGESCRIEGVGPVPVATARRLAMQGFVKALSRDEADVTRVAHIVGRSPRASGRSSRPSTQRARCRPVRFGPISRSTTSCRLRRVGLPSWATSFDSAATTTR